MSGAEQQIWPNLFVAWAFQSPWIGFGLAVVLLVVSVLIVAWNRQRHYTPFTRQIEARLNATAFVAEQPDDQTAQEAFAARFEEIDAAMLEGGRKDNELCHAWTQFSETIVDMSETPLRATSRPEGYFLHLGDDTRVLA